VQPAEASVSLCISLLALTRLCGSIGRLIVSRRVADQAKSKGRARALEHEIEFRQNNAKLF